jgi:hypothetical protein
MVASRFRGLGAFGPAYRILFENDSHAPGSVDRVLLSRMVRLVPETRAFWYGSAPPPPAYRPGERPGLERIVRRLGRDRGTRRVPIRAISRFCVRLSRRASPPIDDLVFGGTEEKIVARGSDFCGEVSRVACALAQVAGYPARLVYLADPDRAYSGHTIVEVYSQDHWGALDALTGVIYRHPDGRPASAQDLLGEPSLIDQHSRGSDPIKALYSRRGQFGRVGLVEYPLGPVRRFSYATSRVNPYYRRILTESEAGWSHGLRWLFGEDRSPPRKHGPSRRTHPPARPVDAERTRPRRTRRTVAQRPRARRDGRAGPRRINSRGAPGRLSGSTDAS